MASALSLDIEYLLGGSSCLFVHSFQQLVVIWVFSWQEVSSHPSTPSSFSLIALRKEKTLKLHFRTGERAGGHLSSALSSIKHHLHCCCTRPRKGKDSGVWGLGSWFRGLPLGAPLPTEVHFPLTPPASGAGTVMSAVDPVSRSAVVAAATPFLALQTSHTQPGLLLSFLYLLFFLCSFQPVSHRARSHDRREAGREPGTSREFSKLGALHWLEEGAKASESFFYR